MPVLVLLGGPEGLGVLEGILALPKQSAGGRPAYPTLFDKAAVLFRSLVMDHPFVDGNKRMAVASTLVFLYLNHAVVCATDDELVDLALKLASGHTMTLLEISLWFREHSRNEDEIAKAAETGDIDALIAELPGDARLRDRPLLDFTLSMFLDGRNH